MVQTAGNAVTFDIVGTVEGDDYEIKSVNKTNAAAAAGKVFALTNTVTPNAFKIADTNSVRPFVVVGHNGAAASDLTMPAVIEGQVYVKAGGAIQPNAIVMPDTNGDAVVYSGSANNELGKFLHLPGDDGAGITHKAAASGDIILIDLNER